MDSSIVNKGKYECHHHGRAPIEPNEGPLEPNILVLIKEDRNNCYDNITANIDRGMPGHPLETEIEKQNTREQAEHEGDYRHYRSLHYPESSIEKHNENNFASEVLRNEFGSRQEYDSVNYGFDLHNQSPIIPTEGPSEPEILIPIKENRNNCYDNINANIDRGMPGHPLEKEINEQEAREKAEQEEDNENYKCSLQDFTSVMPKEGPLEPTVLLPIKEDRNNCYDNINANIDRGMPGHPLEDEIAKQEAQQIIEQEKDNENYECHLQDGCPFIPKEGPLEPDFLLPIKEDRNNCYDNINANIDRGMPGHPLEEDISEQERRELAEHEEDIRHHRSLHYPESAIEKHNENNFVSDVLRNEFGSRQEEGIESAERQKEEDVKLTEKPKEEGIFMQLEVSENDDFSFSSSDSEKSAKVHPPSKPNSSPRAKKGFISSYDPKIFYPTVTKRNSPRRVVHNIVKDPVKLKVTLKEIGLEGLDSKIPGTAAEFRNQERLNRDKMKKQSRTKRINVIKPTNQNQTNFSKSYNRTQFKATNQNQEFSSSMINIKKEQAFDYSSDESYDVHNFDLSDIEDSPPPTLDEIKNAKEESSSEKESFSLNMKKNQNLKVTEPEKQNVNNKSPRKKKETISTYDPSIFYTPISSNTPCEPSRRVKYVNELIRDPIKLTITLKDIGLEGLDSVE